MILKDKWFIAANEESFKTYHIYIKNNHNHGILHTEYKKLLKTQVNKNRVVTLR